MLPPTRSKDPTRPGQGDYRSDLPSLPRERRPHGYRAGLQLVERLQGLGVVALGVLGMLVAYGIYSGTLRIGLPAPPQPSGLAFPVPLVNPAACLIPLLLLSSVALVLVGFRQMLDP